MRDKKWEPLEELVPKEVFKAEVRAWAKRIGVEPREIHIRPMTRKWASCSSRGRLTFDTGLLRQPAGVRAEVIVHELLHLKIPHHGRLFSALLRAYLTENGVLVGLLDSNQDPPRDQFLPM